MEVWRPSNFIRNQIKTDEINEDPKNINAEKIILQDLQYWLKYYHLKTQHHYL